MAAGRLGRFALIPQPVTHEQESQMKKTLFALAAVAALGTTQTTFADSVGSAELAKAQQQIKALQTDKRQVMLDTLALTPEQLSKFHAGLR